jgi:hypothetical protein
MPGFTPPLTIKSAATVIQYVLEDRWGDFNFDLNFLLFLSLHHIPFDVMKDRFEVPRQQPDSLGDGTMALPTFGALDVWSPFRQEAPREILSACLLTFQMLE